MRASCALPLSYASRTTRPDSNQRPQESKYPQANCPPKGDRRRTSRAVFRGFAPHGFGFPSGRFRLRSNRTLTASEDVSGRKTGEAPWSPSGSTLSRRAGARLLQPTFADAARGSILSEVSPPSLPGKLVEEAGLAPAKAGAGAFTARCRCCLATPRKVSTARRETIGLVSAFASSVPADGGKLVGAVRVALTSSRSQAECLKLLGYAPKKWVRVSGSHRPRLGL